MSGITKKEILRVIEKLEEVVRDVRFTDAHVINTTKLTLRSLRDNIREDLDPFKPYKLLK